MHRGPFMEHLSTTASGLAYATSGSAVFLGLTVDEWGIAAAVMGILGMFVTCAFNAWFKMKYGRKI